MSSRAVTALIDRPSPAAAGQQREEEVVAVLWLSADCATVHVRLRVLDEVFVDHLSLVGERDSFRIVAKTWHLDRTLPAQDPSSGVVLQA